MIWGNWGETLYCGNLTLLSLGAMCMAREEVAGCEAPGSPVSFLLLLATSTTFHLIFNALPLKMMSLNQVYSQ